MSPHTLSEYIEGLPNISGSEDLVAQAMARSGPFYLPQSGIDFGRIRSAFAIALHMHQPLIPAGGGDLHTAPVISNLKSMMDNPGIGDNHNAPVFVWCYKRMGLSDKRARVACASRLPSGRKDGCGQRCAWPLNFDSGLRPECARTEHSPTARRTGQVDPLRSFEARGVQVDNAGNRS
jgi:hypothetical protein